MKITTYIFAFTVLLGGFASCIDDESVYGGTEIPQLSIEETDAEGMTVVNFNLGEQCLIHPDIRYTGASEAALQYEWSIGTYGDGVKGELEVVSNERDLSYLFQQGGTYYAHLTVTDGKVGIVKEYQVNINRTFEEGYMLVSNDANGNGNLVFIKTMTPEEIAAGTEQVRIENCLSIMNEGVAGSRLVDADVIKTTVMGANGSYSATRVMLIAEDKCYFLEPNTFTISTEIDYSEIYSGFKATSYIPGYYPYVQDGTSGKYVHFDTQYLFGYESGSMVGNRFDYIFSYPYYAWGSTYSNVYYITHAPKPSISLDNAYYSYGMSPDQFITKEFEDEDVLVAFPSAEMDYSIYAYHNYAITQSGDGKLYFYEFTVNYDFADDYSSVDCSLAPSTYEEMNLADDPAIPVRDVPWTVSATYDRYYYPLDNAVYVCLLDGNYYIPDRSEAALRFDNEEVTYVKVSDDDATKLLVATCDKTSGRGNFYIYDVKDVRTDNPNPQPLSAFRNCADRIVKIVYKTTITQ